MATPPAAAARPPPHRPPPHHHITTPPHRPPRHRLTATPPLAQIREFEKIIKQNARTILGDPFIKLYIEDLLKNIRTQVRPAAHPGDRAAHCSPKPVHPACQHTHLMHAACPSTCPQVLIKVITNPNPTPTPNPHPLLQALERLRAPPTHAATHAHTCALLI